MELFNEDDFLTIYLLSNYVYCKRCGALAGIERMWNENILTIDGQIVHEKAHSGEFESRKDVRIARSLPIHSFALGICGKVDVVEFHQIEDGRGVELSGVRGLWVPYIIEYKRGSKKEALPYKIQLCAQNLCLEEMLKVQIERGAIYWAKSARRQEVVFDPELRSKTVSAIEGLRELLTSGKTPPPRFDNKCRSCSLFDACMPKKMEKRDVNKYWSSFFDSSGISDSDEKT